MYIYANEAFVDPSSPPARNTSTSQPKEKHQSASDDGNIFPYSMISNITIPILESNTISIISFHTSALTYLVF